MRCWRKTRRQGSRLRSTVDTLRKIGYCNGGGGPSLEAEMRSKNQKPSSKFVVSASSEKSSSSDRTMDDSVVIGTVTADNPSVSSGRDVGLHVGMKLGNFLRLWFRTLVRPSGNVEYYQVPSLDRWKRSMDIGNDIDIVYYNRTGSEVVEEGFLCYLNQVAYGLSIPLTFFQKGVMNALKSCPGQLNSNIFEIMRVCEVLNQKWRDGGIARQFVAGDVLKYYKFKYVKDRKSGYLFSDSRRPKFFDFESSRGPEPNPKAVADTSSLFDIVSREGSELNKVLAELGIRREKRLNYVVEKGVNLKAVEQVALDLATRDPIRLDTQIRSSISLLSVAWKSAVEVLKLAVANRAELVRQHDTEKAALQEQFEQKKREKFEKEATATKQEVEDEAKKAVDIAVASRNKLIQAFYVWGLSREDVNLSLAGKYGEIVFPGDDASPVAEQTPVLPVDDDSTKEVEDKENDNVAALSTSNKKLSAKLQQCSLAVERKTSLNLKLESEMLELQSQLNTVTVDLSCKDFEILTANNESEQWKESLKKKKSKTMAAN
ncbi:hypothetical protein GIB67_035271 [Kingdonia uniflora]|uniref:Uncharacterized protein n=1 Tax=Kingdonia uniflora TaxID=39325 RepID=A0A7J7KXV0_9MAGN|nr:hypothetical protein GIB67_035271 [Kingdonia uniflora]